MGGKRGCRGYYCCCLSATLRVRWTAEVTERTTSPDSNTEPSGGRRSIKTLRTPTCRCVDVKCSREVPTFGDSVAVAEEAGRVVVPAGVAFVGGVVRLPGNARWSLWEVGVGADWGSAAAFVDEQQPRTFLQTKKHHSL